MQPEAALVLALAKGDAGGVAVGLGRRPRFDAVARLARVHEVAALCAWTWRSELAVAANDPPLALPADVDRELHHAYLHHRLRNEFALTDVAAIHSAFAVHGVEAMFFKGPWVSLRAYPDLGARPLGDLDLGVHEADYRAAVEALCSIGYRPAAQLPGSPFEALQHAHYVGQIRFWAIGRRPVELHFRMVNLGPPSHQEGWIWATTRPLAVAGIEVRVPGPEAMLLHLLLHANQHGFALLRHLHDIRFALATDAAGLDWNLLQARIDALGCRMSAHAGLVLARDLAGATVPEAALAALRPSALRRAIFSRVWGLAAVQNLKARSVSTRFEALRYYLFEMGRGGDKLRYLGGLIRETIRHIDRRRRELWESDATLPREGTGVDPAAAPVVAQDRTIGPLPGRRRELQLRQLGDEYLVYDPIFDEVTLLNAAAWVILELADGTRTVAEIASGAASAFGMDAETIRAEVNGALQELDGFDFLMPRLPRANRTRPKPGAAQPNRSDALG